MWRPVRGTGILKEEFGGVSRVNGMNILERSETHRMV